MITTRSLAALLLASSLPTAFAQQTKIFINQVPQYSDLVSCAVGPVSTIVRGMARGCGDGGAVTSYNCFCTSSSSFYNDLIATSVSKQCSGTVSDVVSALAVFQSYCEIGNTKTTASSAATSKSAASTTSAEAASTPTPSSAPPTATVTQTVEMTASTPSSSTSPTPEAAHSNMSTGAKAGIAIGMIALAIIIIGGGAFALHMYRRRRAHRGQGASHLPGTTHLPSTTTVNETRPPTSQAPPVPFQQQDWEWQKNTGGSSSAYGSPAPTYNATDKAGPLIDMRELDSRGQVPHGAQELPAKRFSRHELGS